MSETKTLVFRINDNGQGPDLLKQIFLERGWVEFDEDNPDENDWNIWWRSGRFRSYDHDQIQSWQRLNHFPNSTGITKKDCLARNFRRMKAVYGNGVYNFCPDAFNLPNDYTKFVAEYSKQKQLDKPKNLFWICKPADMSRGRGIFIFRNLAELQYDCSAVVQKYIRSPLLIGGYKFDIRIYVAVPSFHPLTIYIYQEGLVRFGTEKYDLTCLDNVYSHLTNTSINKYGPSYAVDKERIGQGCKWTLTQLRQYFRQMHIDDEVIFAKIVNIVILTVLIQAPQVPKTSNSFELYGFDILIDEKLKPFLLEVNFSPALSSDCQIDTVVKKPLLHDLMDMMKFSKKDLNRKDKRLKTNVYRTNVSLNTEYQTHTGRNSVHKFPSLNNFSKFQHSSNVVDEDSDSDLDTDLDSEWNNQEDSICYGLPLVNRVEGDESYNSEDSADQGLSCAEKENFLPQSIQQNSFSSRQGTSFPISNKPVLSERSYTTVSLKKLPSIDKGSKTTSVSFDSGFSSYSGSSDNSDGISWSEDNISTDIQHPSHSVNNLKLTGAKSSLKTYHIQTKKPKHLSFNSRKSSSYSSSFSKYSLGIYIPDRYLESSCSETGTSTKSLTSAALHQKGMKRQTSKKSYRSLHVKRPSTSGIGLQNSFKTPKKFSACRSDFSTRWNVPEKTIGDFFLVFPFNDATKRATASTLDVKSVVQEIQKNSTHTTVNDNMPQVKSNFRLKGKFQHVNLGQDKIWRPLKPMEIS